MHSKVLCRCRPNHKMLWFTLDIGAIYRSFLFCLLDQLIAEEMCLVFATTSMRVEVDLLPSSVRELIVDLG